ncbi:MAG: cation transporter [Anaerolineae bacterium]
MESVLGRLDGVVSADANFVTGKAVVEYDPARVTPTQMVEAVNSGSFFRASLSEGSSSRDESVASAARKSLTPPLLAVAALLILAVGWRAMARRHVRAEEETTG